MKQISLVLIAIIVLPSLISCEEARGLSSRGLFERISSNYRKIKSVSAEKKNDGSDLLQDGMRLFVDMGEPWLYFFFRGLLPARGRKNNWLDRIVPLFILPFLIQSAIVPFIVQTIKLLVIKSLLIGKTALLFFVLGLLKNSSAMKRSGVPYYLKEIPADERPDDAYYHHFAQQNEAAAAAASVAGQAVAAGQTNEAQNGGFAFAAQQRTQ